MTREPALIAALLDTARDLIARRQLDPAMVGDLLDRMPIDDLDVQTQKAVIHARMVAVEAQDGSTARAAVARFALARLVVLLEKGVAPAPVSKTD